MKVHEVCAFHIIDVDGILVLLVSKTAWFSVSDILSICCPATKETKDIINKETLEYYPTGAIITNVARGDMIEDVAMVQALINRKI